MVVLCKIVKYFIEKYIRHYGLYNFLDNITVNKNNEQVLKDFKILIELKIINIYSARTWYYIHNYTSVIEYINLLTTKIEYKIIKTVEIFE